MKGLFSSPDFIYVYKMFEKKNPLIFAMCTACGQHDFHEKSNYIIIIMKKNMLLVPKRGFADENITMVPMLWVENVKD